MKRPPGVLTGIESFIRGSSNRLITSRDLGWAAVSLEAYDTPPGERDETASADHLISLYNGSSRVEIPTAPRGFAPYNFHPGAINILPAGPISAWRSFTPAEIIICALNPQFVREVETESESPSAIGFRCEMDVRDLPLQGVIELLAAEVKSGGLSGKLYADYLAHALALRFLFLSGAAGAGMPPQPGKLSSRVLHRVLDRMRTDLATDLDLRTLAAESGYSRSHFLQMFRAGVGYSPHQWLTRLRVEKAKTKLRENSASLIEIALACGFANHAHFSKRFRENAGMTPSEYRRSHRSNK